MQVSGLNAVIGKGRDGLSSAFGPRKVRESSAVGALQAAQGAHPLAIKERLGHSSITVTLDVYGALFPSIDESLADGLAIVDREPVIINGRPFAKGDQVMTLRNDPKRGLINGERGTISSVSPRDGFYVRFNSDHSEPFIPHAYLNAGYLDHAYAMSVHKAQGLTCDRALVFGSAELYAEAGYTALSRGRLENHLYTTIDEPDVDHHGALTDDPLDQIHAALARSHREHLATRHAHVRPATAERDTGRDHGIDLGR